MAIKHRKSKSVFLFRWSIFMIGLLVMSLGIAMMIQANLGGAPWDVLHVGLMLQFGLTVGTWSILLGLVIIGVTSLLMKQWPPFGSFLNMLLVGLFIDLFMWLLPSPDLLWIRGAMLIVGIIIIGYGMGIYLSPRCGAGPRDSLMLAIQLKTGWKVSRVRGIMEIIVLAVGWFLGGPIFIGTLLFCFGIGSVAGFALPQCQRLYDFIIERGSKYENFNEGSLRTHHHDGTC